MLNNWSVEWKDDGSKKKSSCFRKLIGFWSDVKQHKIAYFIGKTTVENTVEHFVDPLLKTVAIAFPITAVISVVILLVSSLFAFFWNKDSAVKKLKKFVSYFKRVSGNLSNTYNFVCEALYMFIENNTEETKIALQISL